MSNEIISLVGILIGVCGLIYLCYKGLPPMFVAPLCGVLVLIISQQPVVPGITETYAGGFAGFLQKYFLILFLGAIFGAIMGDSGAAKSIARKITRLAKRCHGFEKLAAVWSIIIVAIVLVVGGVSVFVAMFTIVAISKELYQELDVPWRLYGCQILGAGCIALTHFPGSPTVNNIIASTYLGTTLTAAPVLSVLAIICSFTLGTIYILWELKGAKKKGEGFLPTGAEIAKTIHKDDDFQEMSLIVALIPCIVLFILLNVFNTGAVVASFVAIILALIMFHKRLGGPASMVETCRTGAMQAISSSVTASMVVGFGTVIASVPGYAFVLSGLTEIPGPPTIQIIVAVNIAAGITGSSSGGLTIAMDSLSDYFLSTGLNPQIIHRLAVISSGGLDSLPHNGTIVNELGVCKLTHKEGYRPMGVCSVVIPLITVFVCAGLAQIGIC